MTTLEELDKTWAKNVAKKEKAKINKEANRLQAERYQSELLILKEDFHYNVTTEISNLIADNSSLREQNEELRAKLIKYAPSWEIPKK